MFYVISAGLAGDALASLPVLSWIAKELKGSKQKIYIIHTNPEVMRLAPFKEQMVIIGEAWHIGVYPDIENLEKRLKVMTASKAWEAGQAHSLHMAQAHFEYLGLTIPKNFDWFKLDYPKIEIPSYDFLISPFSRSDDNHNKKWFDDRWQIIINRLREKGKSIGVLGMSNCDNKPFIDVDYIFDKPLTEVCNYLENAGTLLSIDNGIAHLNFLGPKIPHVQMIPECLSPTWICNMNANAVKIRGNPINITVEEVWNQIQKFL